MSEPFDSARESLLELLDFVSVTKGIDRFNIPPKWQPVPQHRALVEMRKRRWAERVKGLIAKLDALLDRADESLDRIDPYLTPTDGLYYCGRPTSSYTDFSCSLAVLHLNQMELTTSALHDDDESAYQSIDVRDLQARVVNELRQAKRRRFESGQPALTAKRHVDAVKKRRHRKANRKPKPLTAIQTEAVHIVGECKGDFAEAARRFGKDRKTVQEAYGSAMKKLGKTSIRHSTRPIATDRRGQENIADDADRRGV